MRTFVLLACLTALIMTAACTGTASKKPDQTATASTEDKDVVVIKRTRLMERIELSLGRPVTKYELEHIVKNIVERTKEADKAQTYVIMKTAEQFGIPVNKAATVVPKLSEPATEFRALMTKRLEALLERKLTDNELTYLIELEAYKSTSMMQVFSGIVADLSITTGLGTEVLEAIVPKVGFVVEDNIELELELEPVK